MLRLGRKYAIAHIEKRRLRAYTMITRQHLRVGISFWLIIDKSNMMTNQSRITSEVISIAHEFPLFTILPAAYALC
jgi:hypothetical protein